MPKVAPSSAADAIPTHLRDYLDRLETWAKDNARDARRDAVAFWILKVPAILAAASAGVWAYFDQKAVSVIAGAVASLCVILDGVHPRGVLRNTHLRAVHDLRNLTAGMMAKWQTRDGKSKDDNAVKRIIQEAESERERIGTYIRDAETSLRPESKF
jgi:hypothetical protein